MSSPALAQPGSATAGAEALIQAENVAGLFDALPNPNARLVRHRRSGMMCLFVEGSTAKLEVYDPQRNGDDVSCSQLQSNGADLTMFATRKEASAEQWLGSAQRSLATWAWSAPPQPLGKEVAATDSPFPRSQAAYIGVLRSRPTFVRLATARTPDGWLIKQRLVVPLDAASEKGRERLIAESHLMAETIFFETLNAIAARGR